MYFLDEKNMLSRNLIWWQICPIGVMLMNLLSFVSHFFVCFCFHLVLFCCFVLFLADYLRLWHSVFSPYSILFPGTTELSYNLSCICASQWFSANSVTPAYPDKGNQMETLQPQKKCCSGGEGSPYCLQCREPLQRHWLWHRTLLCPSEEKVFLWEEVKTLVTTTTLFNGVVFQGKSHTPHLQRDVSYMSYNLTCYCRFMFWSPLTIKQYSWSGIVETLKTMDIKFLYTKESLTLDRAWKKREQKGAEDSQFQPYLFT